MMPTLRYAGGSTVPGTHQHEGVSSGGDSKMSPVGHGSAISTCLVPAIHGAWGSVGEGQGIPVPWPPALEG